MKIYLALLIIALSAVAASAQTLEAPITPIKKRPARLEVRATKIDGALVRGARGGNFLQMYNPKAPAIYGTAEDSVIIDPETGKWKGIKLFTIWW